MVIHTAASNTTTRQLVYITIIASKAASSSPDVSTMGYPAPDVGASNTLVLCPQHPWSKQHFGVLHPAMVQELLTLKQQSIGQLSGLSLLWQTVSPQNYKVVMFNACCLNQFLDAFWQQFLKLMIASKFCNHL